MSTFLRRSVKNNKKFVPFVFPETTDKCFEINKPSDLEKDCPPRIRRVKINIPNLQLKDIANLVIKYERSGEVWIKTEEFSHFSKNGFLIFGNHRGPNYPLKRKLDLIVGTLAFAAFLPLCFLTSLMLKLSSKGDVLFRQTRIGEGGKLFNFYKFRTMRYSNQTVIHRNYMQRSINGQVRARKIHKLVNDPRITLLGKLLRKLSIDEMPQLINVLKGEMSLVGPRPPIPYEVELYEEWHKTRLRTKPGITGLWQVMGRSFIPFEKMVILDLYYASNQSLGLDLKILLKTIPVVISLKGAY